MSSSVLVEVAGWVFFFFLFIYFFFFFFFFFFSIFSRLLFLFSLSLSLGDDPIQTQILSQKTFKPKTTDQLNTIENTPAPAPIYSMTNCLLTIASVIFVTIAVAAELS